MLWGETFVQPSRALQLSCQPCIAPLGYLLQLHCLRDLKISLCPQVTLLQVPPGHRLLAALGCPLLLDCSCSHLTRVFKRSASETRSARRLLPSVACWPDVFCAFLDHGKMSYRPVWEHLSLRSTTVPYRSGVLVAAEGSMEKALHLTVAWYSPSARNHLMNIDRDFFLSKLHFIANSPRPVLFAAQYPAVDCS